jgi:hypothetical protein
VDHFSGGIPSGQIKERASVPQSKNKKPVQFEISEGTRASVAKWMEDPLISLGCLVRVTSSAFRLRACFGKLRDTTLDTVVLTLRYASLFSQV